MQKETTERQLDKLKPEMEQKPLFYVNTEENEYHGTSLKNALLLWASYKDTDKSDVTNVGRVG